MISNIRSIIFANVSIKYLSLPYLTGNGFATSCGILLTKLIICSSLSSDKLNSFGGLSVKLSLGTKSQQSK